MNVARFPVWRARRYAKVPLQVGDVWVHLGPATEFAIVALRPRPTSQKPDSQAVTLDNGRTITEATLRYAYQRKQEYEGVFLPELRRKLRALFPERCQSAQVIPFPQQNPGPKAPGSLK